MGGFSDFFCCFILLLKKEIHWCNVKAFSFLIFFLKDLPLTGRIRFAYISPSLDPICGLHYVVPFIGGGSGERVLGCESRKEACCEWEHGECLTPKLNCR